MQNASWMNHKLESRLLGEISTASDMHMIPPNGRKQRRIKEPPDEGGLNILWLCPFWD